MGTETAAQAPQWEDTDGLLLDRGRLVRFCARFTGDRDAAEDLAQQTLLEAWRHAGRLRDPAARDSWLFGIARNVCLQWARRRASEAAVRLDRDRAASGPDSAPDDRLADDFDLELELERDDLARLLDRALALLPPATRALLIGRYVEESPQAEVAARLGLTQGAVEARVQRGKLALRRVLTGELREEAAAHGLIRWDDEGWQETRIWCPGCGERKLLGRFAEGGDLQLDCPGCRCRGGSRAVQVRSWVAERAEGVELAELFAGVKGYKPVLNRLMAHGHEFYKQGIARLTAQCLRCGGEAPLRTSPYTFLGYCDVRTNCPHCGQSIGITTTSAIALDTPEARGFWRTHGRIRTLPAREVAAASGPAIVARFASVTGSARLEVILARDTLEVIGIHGAPGR